MKYKLDYEEILDNILENCKVLGKAIEVRDLKDYGISPDMRQVNI